MQEVIDGFRKTFEEREIQKYGKILSEEERNKVSEAEIEEEKQRERRDRIAIKMRDFKDKLPPRFELASFDNYRCSNDKQRAVVEYMKQGKSAVVYGSNGTGKTHLAFAACRHQIHSDNSARYVLAFDFFNEIKRSFGDNSTVMVVHQYTSYDYLVIDEIDKTIGTPTEFTYLYSLINKRYNYMRSTVLITNSTPSEFVTIIGQSALDRVASEGKVIELTGENYRHKRV